MKFIIVVDGVKSAKYKYNLHTCHEYEDGAVSESARLINTDDLEEFLRKLRYKLSQVKEET